MKLFLLKKQVQRWKVESTFNLDVWRYMMLILKWKLHFFMFFFLFLQNVDRDIPMGHSPRGNPPDVEWEPYFCVLNQLDQTFTSYRSEEMSVSAIIIVELISHLTSMVNEKWMNTMAK